MIKLAEDVANAGSWNQARWHATLAQLTSEPVNTSQDPEEQQPKETEEEKTPGNDDQSTV